MSEPKCEGCGKSPPVLTRIDSGQYLCMTCMRELRAPDPPPLPPRPRPKRLTMVKDIMRRHLVSELVLVLIAILVVVVIGMESESENGKGKPAKTDTEDSGVRDVGQQMETEPENGKGEPAKTVDKDAGVRAAGQHIAKKLIKPKLKAPQSAEFPWDSITYERMEPLLVDLRGDKADRWRVRGAVDAQNSFGAKMRSWWEVIVLSWEGTFLPARVKLEGKIVFQWDAYSQWDADSRYSSQTRPR